MTRQEKEAIIDSWPYPFPEYMSLLQESRSTKINAPDADEDEVARYHKEYDNALDRVLAQGNRHANRT
jgi:hypothetical protein